MTDEQAIRFKATEDVISFLARELDVPQAHMEPSTRLRQDLGLDGEDAEYLFEAFGLHFDLDLSGFRVNDYFAADAGMSPFFSYILWIFGNGKPILSLRISDLVNMVVKKRLVGTRICHS